MEQLLEGQEGGCLILLITFTCTPLVVKIFLYFLLSHLISLLRRLSDFAGQELITCQSRHTKAELFYWGRKAKNSTAEVDYLIEKDGEVIPIEIKSGSTGRMKSMHMFVEQFNTQKALKISQAPFADGKPIISLPFYGIESFMLIS